jgi:2-polyprenyl-3-methyl-5-hydroxy-6-metoxy-1,4-benzoquinol methylase
VGDADADRYFAAGEFRARDRWEERHYWHLHRRMVLRRALGRVALPSGARLIEVGCGVGTVATYLNEHGYRVDYADVHEDALDRARRRARERLGAGADDRRFVRLDVTAEPPPPGYQGVLLLDVLEHLPDDLGVLRRIGESLAPAGPPACLVLTVPAFPALWSRWDEAEHHQRRYTRRQLCAVAEAAGFRIERATHFFLPLFAPAWAVARLQSRRRKTLGPSAAAADPTTLVEFQHGVRLSRLMLPVLGPERWWLARGNLPFGTSLLLVARPR